MLKPERLQISEKEMTTPPQISNKGKGTSLPMVTRHRQRADLPHSGQDDEDSRCWGGTRTPHPTTHNVKPL